MQTYSQTFTGAGVWPIGVGGDYFRILSAPSPVDVKFYRGGMEVGSATSMDGGFYIRPAGGFDRVDIVSSVAQTVKVFIMVGDGGYDHFNVDIASSIGSIAVSLSGAADVTIAQGDVVLDLAPMTALTGATLLFSASSACVSLRVANDSVADVFLGGSAVTPVNGGIKIAPGEMWLESDGARANWYCVATANAGPLRVQRVRR